MPDKLNWGIIGTGNIASIFAGDMAFVEDGRLLGVGSRSGKKADEFGKRFGIERSYSSYSDLAADPDIDIIYIASPHTFHFEHAVLCLENNKSVLCEKPFTVNTPQAAEVIRLAKDKNLFVMEAMWTRFLPLMKTLKDLVENGVIGKVMSIHADFCFYHEFDKSSRLFDPALAGGALLDVGVYPVMLAHTIFGKPKTIQANAFIGKTGVDESTSAIFDYGRGKIATFQSSVIYTSPLEAVLSGTKGYIKIHPRWFEMSSLSIYKDGYEPEIVQEHFDGRGFHFEIKEAQRCIRNGSVESSLMPHSDTIEIMETLDRIRDIVGLRYPFE